MVTFLRRLAGSDARSQRPWPLDDAFGIICGPFQAAQGISGPQKLSKKSPVVISGRFRPQFPSKILDLALLGLVFRSKTAAKSSRSHSVRHYFDSFEELLHRGAGRCLARFDTIRPARLRSEAIEEMPIRRIFGRITPSESPDFGV